MRLDAATNGSDRAITVPVDIAGAIDTHGLQLWFMGGGDDGDDPRVLIAQH